MRIGRLGLRTLNVRLQQVAPAKPQPTDKPVPPILRIDATWVTLLLPTGEMRADRCGRMRPVVERVKRPVLIALGVWPDSGRREILAW